MKTVQTGIRSGDVIHNPISGETFRFLKTAAETGGTLLELECTVTPGGRLAAPLTHIHPKQNETFVIFEGHLRTVIGGVERVYGPGETVFIPAGTPHIWFNASNRESVRFLIRFDNPGGWEVLFAATFDGAREGRTRPDGSMPLLPMAVALHRYPDHFYLAGPPIWLQKLIFALLFPVGRLLGHDVPYSVDHGRVPPVPQPS
ncbi:cupin domain-containing protein [Deinococcus apachensis]|uniref:cupin domain-containing protein n=1 Tax=Deinococcus apachensis TaxID=309886 RepID=UPI00036A552A|nr:cupin domain-containing protein [Deinococcus apachensis]